MPTTKAQTSVCIRAVLFHSLENAIDKFAINKMSIIQLVVEAEQADFRFTWSQTPNAGPEIIKHKTFFMLNSAEHKIYPAHK